ncbi:MAG: EF-hand domain-containing protein [Verrucomicrobiae bacterium]|nr:EF-hand domain-containing protein [Verrucomicrobiae bacterium]
MKKSLVSQWSMVTAMVAGLVVVCNHSVQAEELSPEQGSQKMIKRFDTNHDGKLDSKELEVMKAKMAEMRKEHQERMLEKFDKNKDGQLDDQERAEMQKARQAWQEQRAENREKVFEKLDLNKDGKLDETELKKAQEKRLDKAMSLDTNKDGKIDKKEWEARKPQKE